MGERFDYVIVGAGSAGCVVANRLSADPARRVLLLEAGPRDASFRIQMPAAFTYAISSRRFDWRFESEREANLERRPMPYPRGKVLGGSSSINAMCFTRGHPAGFDGWAGNGLAEWSYAHCLPYFKRLETFSGGANAYRGGDGPLNVTAPAFSNPLCEVFLSACEQAGFARCADTNGQRAEGVGPLDQTIHLGRRMSAARAYLEPVRGRTNLAVRTGAIVGRVLVDGRRATGVELAGGRRVYAHAEVILCAGALKSPQLLMLSGIGEADHLRAHDIEVRAHLPAVGRHLQDHLDIQIQQQCTQPITATPALALHRKALIGLEWLLFKTGAGASNHFEVGGYVRSRDGLERPDLAAWFMPLLVNYDGSPVGVAHGYQLTFMQLQPRSRGRVSLRSRNPLDAPLIEANFLAEPGDLEMLRAGVKCGRRVFAQAAFDAYRGPEIAPGDAIRSDADIDRYVRRTAKSTRHPSCTCRMGMDEESSVVDGEGRVHGIEALRVVDASVMPSIAAAALNAPTLMVAEKLADRIAGRAPLAPMMAEAAAASAASMTSPGEGHA